MPDKPLELWELAYHSILFRRFVEPGEKDSREYSIAEFAVFADVSPSYVYKLINGKGAVLTPIWVKTFNEFFAKKDPTDFEPQRCLMANEFMPVRIPKERPASEDREELKRTFLQLCADSLKTILVAEKNGGSVPDEDAKAFQALAQAALEFDERRKRGIL